VGISNELHEDICISGYCYVVTAELQFYRLIDVRDGAQIYPKEGLTAVVDGRELDIRELGGQPPDPIRRQEPVGIDNDVGYRPPRVPQPIFFEAFSYIFRVPCGPALALHARISESAHCCVDDNSEPCGAPCGDTPVVNDERNPHAGVGRRNIVRSPSDWRLFWKSWFSHGATSAKARRSSSMLGIYDQTLRVF
jgi:hypothetical protein